MIVSSNKFNTLSAIFRDASQVFFASMFVGPIIGGSAINWPLALIGLVLAYFGWFVSFILTKG